MPKTVAYTPELLEEAARRIVDEGEAVKDVAESLGVQKLHLSIRVKKLRGIKTLGHGLRRRVSIKIPENVGFRGYLAGLLDGEGSISRNATRESIALRGGGRGWHVCIHNTDKALMDWLVAEIGGGIHMHAPPKLRYGFVNVKPAYIWNLCGAIDNLCFLEAVLPYLRIKRAKAELAIHEIRTEVLRDIPHVISPSFDVSAKEATEVR